MLQMTDTGTALAGHLLIAMPTLTDPNFWRAVVLLGVHSREEGAFGLVINRGLDIALPDVLRELSEEPEEKDYPAVLGGGPVEPNHGFVLFERNEAELDDAAITIDGNVAVSGSTETLSDLVHGRISGRFYLLLGYAGWAPGQLEHEIEDNSWLVAPIDHSLLFDVPLEQRWDAALRSIGVEPGALVDTGSSAPS